MPDNIDQSKRFRFDKQSFLFLLLPLFVSWYPALFLYGTNVNKLLLPSLARILILFTLIAIAVFIAAYILTKRNALSAANASFVFLIFFNTYGLIYKFLVKTDWISIEHYIFLPLFLLISAYAVWLTARKSTYRFWKLSFILVGIAASMNMIKIIPAEIAKAQAQDHNQTVLNSGDAAVGSQNYPDIYFIIFDEFAGFNTMRSYWNYQGVDEFINFAESKGFYVALDSNSSSLSTFHQLAERLNFKSFPIVDVDDVNTYFDDLVNNRVMSYLKNKGYKIVVFEETEHFFGGYPKFNADYLFEYDASALSNLNVVFDNFGILVSDNSMLLAFSKYYKIADPRLAQHRDWINFTADKVADLRDVQSPKFVYIHLILPHTPFVFDENGNKVDPKFYYNWNYYLGNYKYAINIAKRMINNLSPATESSNPPVIIIQSDHGARNIKEAVFGSEIFPDFPEEYKYNIMNMMNLPGYDYSKLTQDMKPINTFPLIFNHYFGDSIPLQ